MTKKHFIALAEAIRFHNQPGMHNTKFTQDQLETLAHFCAEQNHHFNDGRWFGYIAGTNGPNGGKR